MEFPMSLFRPTLTAALIVLGGSIQLSAAPAQPNLVPAFSVQTGKVAAKNIGTAPARPSIITVKCTGMAGASCPDPTPAQAAPYLDAAFPNQLAIDAPKLAAGASHSHAIAFFNSLVFAPGKYVFTVCVDAGSDVAESTEGDNCKRYVKTVRRIGQIAPQKPLLAGNGSARG